MNRETVTANPPTIAGGRGFGKAAGSGGAGGAGLGLPGPMDDFTVIAGLLLFNAGLEFWQNRKASSALAALKNSLAPEATALRDGQWQTVPAATLVPGDIVKIRLGVIVPADLRLVKGSASRS